MPMRIRPFVKEKMPVPPDFRRLPLNPALPVDIEIGCGVGFHPLRYARDNPGRQLVAIERTSEKFEKFAARISHHEALPNLFPVHGDAIAWITHGFGDASVDKYFILYPNPYPKESQKNLRFARMPFFSHLRSTMKPGAELVLATNISAYAAEAEEWLLKEWGLILAEKTALPKDFTPRTHFEKKYLARGEACWNLRFRASGRATSGANDGAGSGA